MKHLFLSIAVTGVVFTAYAQKALQVQLKQVHANYAPKEYYISDVVDDRADNSSIGTLTERGGNEKIVFQNGATASIKGFIEQNVSQNKAKQPVVIHIAGLDVSVRKNETNWEVKASTTFVFYVAGKKVIEYSEDGGGQTNAEPADYIEGFIRQSVEGDLKEFENAWAQNKGKIPTKSTVKVNVAIGRSTDKPDNIVYSLQRPLSISDFTGPAEGEGQELAVTASGISLTETDEQIQDGQIVLNIIVTPLFDKSRSWFKEAGKTPYVLAHEQAHFDITAIKACELAATIRNTVFTQENFEKLIAQLQEQNTKDAKEEENTYDTETNHGIIENKQIEWQNKIKQKVKEIGCY